MTKTIFDNTVSNVDSKIEATKTVNTSHENLLKRLKKLYLGYFIGKNYFEEDGTQNYLVFQPISRYFKTLPNLIMFYHGNLKDYLLKLLNHILHHHLLHLIIILYQY